MIKFGWIVRNDENCIPHVLPTSDDREHLTAMTCWCKPTDDEGVMVHHALDRREHFDSTMNILRPTDPDHEYLRCSHHPLCEGPRLRSDHDEICDDGEECTDDECWRGCQYCIRVGSEN